MCQPLAITSGFLPQAIPGPNQINYKVDSDTSTICNVNFHEYNAYKTFRYWFYTSESILLTTSTMRGFSEATLSVLLVAFTLRVVPSLFVNGQLRPTSNYKPARRSTVIRGLLVTRQDYCQPGFDLCESIGCCLTGWNCCIGSSLPPTFFLSSCHR